MREEGEKERKKEREGERERERERWREMDSGEVMSMTDRRGD